MDCSSEQSLGSVFIILSSSTSFGSNAARWAIMLFFNLTHLMEVAVPPKELKKLL